MVLKLSQCHLAECLHLVVVKSHAGGFPLVFPLVSYRHKRGRYSPHSQNPIVVELLLIVHAIALRRGGVERHLSRAPSWQENLLVAGVFTAVGVSTTSWRLTFWREGGRVAVQRAALARTSRALRAPLGMAASPSMEPYVVLGVMANPSNPRLRDQWRGWGQRFVAYQHSVRVRFVFGSSFYEAGLAEGAPTAPQLDLEQASRGDLIFVDGREKLPNVGVVTEKSAAFWRSASAREPAARWTCKCDDDTLVHLDRLEATLRHVEERNPEQAVYLGHVKWRGWDAGDLGADTYTDGFRFQARLRVG